MDKKNKIIDAALSLFVDNGFHGTSTSAITTAAGVSTGILFHYFKNKEELIIYLYLQTKIDFFSSILENIESVPEFENKMKQLWHNVFNWGIKWNKKFSFLKQYQNTPFCHQTKDEPEFLELLGNLRSLINTGMTEKKLKDIPVDLHLTNMFSLTGGLVDMILKNPAQGNDKQFLHKAWISFWDCIKKQ